MEMLVIVLNFCLRVIFKIIPLYYTAYIEYMRARVALVLRVAIRIAAGCHYH